MWDDTVLKYITVLKSTAHCTQTQCTVLYSQTVLKYSTVLN